MDRLFASAEREQPLEWQAYRVRLRKQDVIGTADAPARIVAMRRL
jgi:hypothetical protein